MSLVTPTPVMCTTVRGRREQAHPIRVRKDRSSLKEILMGSIEALADVFFAAGKGFISTFLGAVEGVWGIATGSLK